MVWRVALVAAWLAALVGLFALDPDGAKWYIAGGIPLTVLVGGLIDRWGVAAVPYGITAALAIWTLASGPDCRDCADGDESALIIWVVFLTFAIPASAALAIGVGSRRLLRLSRDQHA